MLTHTLQTQTEKLFSYGTLQDEKVQLDTFDRRLTGTAAALSGYGIEQLQITDPYVLEISEQAVHRILVHTGNPKDIVKGVVFDVTPDELEAADAYEVGDYQRVQVQLTSGERAWVYVGKEYIDDGTETVSE